MVIASGTLQVEKGIVNLDSFVATNEKEFIKLEKWCEKKYVSIKVKMICGKKLPTLKSMIFLRISGINGRNNGRTRNNLSHGSDSGFHYLYRRDDTFPQMDKKRQQRRRGE